MCIYDVHKLAVNERTTLKWAEIEGERERAKRFVSFVKCDIRSGWVVWGRLEHEENGCGQVAVICVFG